MSKVRAMAPEAPAPERTEAMGREQVVNNTRQTELPKADDDESQRVKDRGGVASARGCAEPVGDGGDVLQVRVYSFSLV